MNLFPGFWNTTESQLQMHSPLRLLQKLTAFRASSSSTPQSLSPSPSPQNERKSTILSESANFFARLWRPSTSREAPSQSLTASRGLDSSSFDHISESTLIFTDNPPTTSSPLPRLTHRISLIRDVSPKPSPPPLLCSFPSPTVQHQQQPTISDTLSNSLFDDEEIERLCNTRNEFYSRSFEINTDSTYRRIVNEQIHENISEQQRRLSYDERQHRMKVSTKSVQPVIQEKVSLPLHMIETPHNDSLTSPEASIDISMVSSKHSLTMVWKKKKYICDNTNLY